MSNNLFIVFEGLDGSGKSTQMDLLQNALTDRGHTCLLTAEPTDLPMGLMIRDVLEHRQEVHPQSVAALFAADRLEHLHHPTDGILAQLAAGNTVICSRYYFSSLAYQSEYASLEWIAAINWQARNTRPADLTFFLDLAPEVSMSRIKANRDQIDLFETIEKLTDVRAAFRRAFDYWGQDSRERIHRIDASRPIEAVAAEILSIVEARLTE